ncbi:DNA/RNA non-specific endonuclease [Bradyrhizobium sp. sBnM-33]|uniref:DNA/RNA non-specific endonuclease n=1 Tax=Bradyrhizobium sp. sBnM-33 TaxID=2831780 RepID=UPI001BCAA73C|nr:DNA/RNA non-specific endonuclease [Bradyrhizobium sp. sBnM-33]WOH52621.1 DNA/RNA non-specific endonuclease [Bradyrhizobium sp. sBnM-33]
MAGNPERLKQYIEMLARAHGGMDHLVDVAREKQQRDGPSAAGIESAALGREVPPEHFNVTEAIIDEEIRPAFDIVDGTFDAPHRLWTKLKSEDALRERIEAVIPSVGRIELPGNRRIPYGGTGFVVGRNLLMTNRHVAELFARGLGDRRVTFISGAGSAINFTRENGKPPGQDLRVSGIRMIHPYWDMAILELEQLPEGHFPLKLSLLDARELPEGHEIFVIGYPAFDPRNPSDVQNTLFDSRYGTKRLQPGALQGRGATASFGKLVDAAAHDCSTLGGNSGSAVFDLSTGDVLALHFGGLYHEKNFGVPASELSRDGRVISAGVSFAGQPSGGQNGWADWWRQADESETATAPPSDHATSAVTSSHASVSLVDNSVTFEIPLRVTVSLGAVRHVAPVAPATVLDSVTEALKEPIHDTDYSTRRGYSANFIRGVSVPMPSAEDAEVLAPTKSGDTVLHYQNFSISMHAKRRLALFTASNVTGERALRKPTNDNYTRKGLSGLDKNDIEKWFLDDRIDPKYQLPDVFFTKDRKAFDKGHIVRRDDVAWGRTFEEVQRANGDSYHVTNCSPQVADFNQSSKGEDNWGDLENHVLKSAGSERLCVFAGPILKETDDIFVGKGDANTRLRARIPVRFWKVIVAKVEEGIAAYGFILEQDLSDVAWEEFVVPEEYLPTMYPLSEISEETGVAFDPDIMAADQYDTLRGREVSRSAGARRRKNRS